jgi:hypothetical protein
VNVLTRSKLVVKRIASKQTKEPRVPLTAELLVGEVTRRGAPRRFRHDFIFLFDSFFRGWSSRFSDRALDPPLFIFSGGLVPALRADSRVTTYCHLKACASF